jgi:hypothetical protein
MFCAHKTILAESEPNSYFVGWMLVDWTELQLSGSKLELHGPKTGWMGQKEQQGREGRTPPIRSDENLDDAFGWKRRVILHRFTVLPFIKLNSYFWYSFHIFLVVCPPYLYISTSSTFLYVFLFFYNFISLYERLYLFQSP